METKFIPEGQPQKSTKYESYVYKTWTYNPSITLDYVMEEYRKEYHQDPQMVFKCVGLVWAGPVPQEYFQ